MQVINSCPAGIHPDVIVLRSGEPIEDEGIFRKIALFCNVQPDCVIENRTVPCLYEAPLMLEEANFSGIVCTRRERPWLAATARSASRSATATATSSTTNTAAR